MEYVTKNILEEHHLSRLILSLTEIREASVDLEDKAKENFRNKFLSNLKKDPAFEGITLEKKLEDAYFFSKIEENERLINFLPNEILRNLKNSELLKFECCLIEDNKILTPFVEALLDGIEERLEKAKKESEKVLLKLEQRLELDFFLGEIVTKITENNEFFILHFGDVCLVLKGYKILKRDDFVITEWNEDDPFSPYAILRFAEVKENNGKLIVNLLFTLADEFEKFTQHEIVLECETLYKK